MKRCQLAHSQPGADPHPTAGPAQAASRPPAALRCVPPLIALPHMSQSLQPQRAPTLHEKTAGALPGPGGRPPQEECHACCLWGRRGGCEQRCHDRCPRYCSGLAAARVQRAASPRHLSPRLQPQQQRPAGCVSCAMPSPTLPMLPAPMCGDAPWQSSWGWQ
eukprot:355524-Chlamydomonas_euryale.AAC.28